MGKIFIALFGIAIVFIGGNIVAAIVPAIPDGGAKTLLIVGLSAAAIIDIIVIIAYTLKRK
jgi:hypothetical protein